MALGPGPEKATYDPDDRPPRDLNQEALESLGAVRKQAESYLEARYGKNVWYRAPETFGPFERWVWAVAGAHDDLAAKVMGEITTHFREEQQS